MAVLGRKYHSSCLSCSACRSVIKANERVSTLGGGGALAHDILCSQCSKMVCNQDFDLRSVSCIVHLKLIPFGTVLFECSSNFFMLIVVFVMLFCERCLHDVESFINSRTAIAGAIIGLLLVFFLFRRHDFCYDHMTSQPLFVHSFMQFQLNFMCDVIFRS